MTGCRISWTSNLWYASKLQPSSLLQCSSFLKCNLNTLLHLHYICHTYTTGCSISWTSNLWYASKSQSSMLTISYTYINTTGWCISWTSGTSASLNVQCSSFWKSPRSGGRSSYADGWLCVDVVGSVVVEDVVSIVEDLVVVDGVVVVVVVVGGGVVNGSAAQEPLAGPASRQDSHVSTDFVHAVTAQQVQQQSPSVAMTTTRTTTTTTTTCYKKLSYRRETARQLLTSRWGGLDPPVHSPSSGYAYAYARIRKPQRTYVKRAVRKAHFKMNRAFMVIQGHPYWCRQESRMVCCRNVQLMPTSFL